MNMLEPILQISNFDSSVAKEEGIEFDVLFSHKFNRYRLSFKGSINIKWAGDSK